MKNIVTILSFTFCLILGSVNEAFAQKYGHMNLGNLLTQLDEVKAAEKELETYRIQMMNIGQDMVKNYEVVLAAAQQEIAANNWSPARIQQEQEKLQKDEQKILKYEQEVMQQVQIKREELLAPILTKVENAIKEVAEEKGYEMIFDTGIFNALLFAKDSEDIIESVKSKLQ